MERLGWPVTMCVLTFTSVLVVVLTLQNRELGRMYAEARQRSVRPFAGMYVPAFDATTLDGDVIRIGAVGPDSLHLVYFLRPDCPYCLESLRAWQRLARDLEGSTVSVVAMSLDSVATSRAYVEEHGIEFVVVNAPDERTVAVYRGGRVPVTVLVDQRGRLAYTHLGVFEQADADSVRTVIDVVRSGFRERRAREAPSAAAGADGN